jgi:hypothetical protein
MNKKRKSAATDAELEKPFDFSDAHPNPYVGWSRRARTTKVASGGDPPGASSDSVAPMATTDLGARKKTP